jgi:AraC-like DNA-binding protein
MPPERHIPRGFVTALRDAGVDLTSAARAAGIAPARMNGAADLAPDELAGLLEAVFSGTGDAAIGLRLGACVKPELFGVVGLAAISAPTYGAALARCARYKRLLTDLRVDVERHGERTAVRVDIAGAHGPSSRARIDAELAFFVCFGRRMTEAPVSPLELWVRSARPPHAAEYRRLFECPVRFGQRTDTLWIPTAALETPLLAADSEVHTLLAATADRHLEELSDRMTARVRAVVESLLPEGPPSIDSVARRLAVSERSLQRGLHGEGTSFTELVDETRRALARRYLEEDRFAAVEISYLVGFSHPNSFYRAFRRWTGTTPEAYRRASRAG